MITTRPEAQLPALYNAYEEGQLTRKHQQIVDIFASFGVRISTTNGGPPVPTSAELQATAQPARPRKGRKPR